MKEENRITRQIQETCGRLVNVNQTEIKSEDAGEARLAEKKHQQPNDPDRAKIDKTCD